MLLSAATAAPATFGGRLLLAARTTGVLVAFLALPIFFAVLFTISLVRGPEPFDFHTFWWSGHDVLHGLSPYPATLPHVAHQKTFRPFVYPAPAAYAMVPFALLPIGVANVLWALLGAGAVLATLYVLGVRDWRCYGAVFLWPTVWSSLINGAISALLVLACAFLWRYRERTWIAGALVAALVVFKLYLWPLGVFLLATRRFRATVAAIVIAGGSTLAAWAAIGFAGLREYPQLIDRLTSLVGAQSYSPYALFVAGGASAATARLLMFGCGAVVLLAVVVRGRHVEGERAAFILAIGASLVLTPIVWPHYLALVVVVLALVRPRVGPAWLAPAVLWPLSPAWSDGNGARIGAVLALTAALVGWAAWAASRPRPLPAEVRIRPHLRLGLE
jgi:hypothetical protein